MAIRLNIQEQPRLPMLKQVELTADGIHHRLVRSVITLSVIALAVAFLVNILTESTIARSCKEGVFALSAQNRDLSRYLRLVSQKSQPEELRLRLAEIPENSWQIKSLQKWLGLTDEQLKNFHHRCIQSKTFYAWFDGLKLGHRRILAGNVEPEELFDQLADAKRREKFAKDAMAIPLTLPPKFLDFAADHARFRTTLDQVSKRFNHAMDGLAAHGLASDLGEQLTQATEPSARKTLADQLTQARLELPAAQLDNLILQAQEQRQRRQLNTLMSNSDLATAWKKQFNGMFLLSDALVDLANQPNRAEWVAQWYKEAKRPLVMDAPTMRQVAQRMVETQKLSALEERLIADYGEQPGISKKTFWLIVVSLMVCMVGITNAMLISVIERFREIATMKCLGALDSFIATLFLLEAAFLGLVGGLIGVVLGLIIGIARMLVSYGPQWVGQFFPWTGILVAAGIAVLCGLGLATLAAIYPAFSASRMPPMEAMRVQ